RRRAGVPLQPSGKHGARATLRHDRAETGRAPPASRDPGPPARAPRAHQGGPSPRRAGACPRDDAPLPGRPQSRPALSPVERGHVDPDFWDRFLTREALQAIDIVQKAYQARDLDRRLAPAKAEHPVPPEELPALRDALRCAKASIENLRLYPPGHPLVEETA